MGWTYYKENICTDNVVARYTNNAGFHVCDIYEGRNGYYADCYARGVALSWIEYGKAKSLNSAEEEQGEAIDVLFARLKHACELFEEGYCKQVENLKRTFGFL